MANFNAKGLGELKDGWLQANKRMKLDRGAEEKSSDEADDYDLKDVDPKKNWKSKKIVETHW